MNFNKKNKNIKTIKENYGSKMQVNNYTYIEETIEEDENFIIYKTCTLIDKKSTNGKKFLKNTYLKQNSPVKLLLQQIDKNNHKDIRENKSFDVLYDLPEELKDEFNVSIKDIIDYYQI